MEPNTWLWIIAGALAAVYVGTGLLKISGPQERLIEAGLGWAEDYTQRQLRLLGFVELVGAVLLVVPPLVGVPILTPIAASVLAADSAVAVAVHVRRRELNEILRHLALVVLCVVLAYFRFGPQAF